ncbi:unnamed protein product [Oncorhynchus mykiss]|uniref:BMERB domain-containing protein n=1 Tax=Oncorhynchus mykiss TaxID=8022 RepID=A0A060WAM6_ONCMY|nr:unnamed protein product [Oncorhynchus mykiss]
MASPRTLHPLILSTVFCTSLLGKSLLLPPGQDKCMTDKISDCCAQNTNSCDYENRVQLCLVCDTVLLTHGSSERQRRRQEETVIQQDKREQLKRLHRAQVIQRQLEEVGEKQKNLEERGVTIEKVLRGESPGEPRYKGDGLSDEHELLQMWFKLVLEKNRLARYEEELVIFAQELELEDRQSQLQRDLRCRMSINDSRKSSSELAEEQEMLTEIMKVVERRDTLVSQLEEQRLQERAEDRDPESLILSRGYQFHWT